MFHSGWWWWCGAKRERDGKSKEKEMQRENTSHPLIDRKDTKFEAKQITAINSLVNGIYS